MKSAGNCGFAHILSGNSNRKVHFLCSVGKSDLPLADVGNSFLNYECRKK